MLLVELLSTVLKYRYKVVRVALRCLMPALMRRGVLCMIVTVFTWNSVDAAALQMVVVIGVEYCDHCLTFPSYGATAGSL